MMIQTTLPVGPLQCNCQIIVCPETFQAAVIDPGDEPERIISRIEQIEKEHQKKVQVKVLLHTHAHYDHIGATRKVKEAFSMVPSIALHQADEFIYKMLTVQRQMIYGPRAASLDASHQPLSVDHFLSDEEEVEIGKLKIQVRHTPGHSPGGVCFHLKEDSSLGAKETLFSGDTLFHENIGRADLWGGDEELLVKSVRNRIFTLDDDITVWPGHGPKTSVGHEKRNNRYCA